MKPTKTQLGAILLALLVVVSGAAAYTVLFSAGSGTAYEADSGLVVSTTTDHGLDGSNPFLDDQTVYVDGVTLSASGPADVTVDQFRGERTHVSQIDASTTTIAVDPDDKSAVEISGSVTALSWEDAAIDGSAQLTFSAGGSGTIVIDGLDADRSYAAVTTDGTVLSSGTTTADGEATIEVGAATDADVVLLEPSAPVIDDASASPTGGEVVDSADPELSIDVSDSDFPDDEVTVEFRDASDDSVIGTDTLASNGTATTTWSSLTGGSHTWYAVAEDKYGETTESQTHEFGIPAQLEIRDESNPDDLITEDEEGNPITVEVVFFDDNEVIERTADGDGTVDMTGLPADRPFVVQAQAEGFITRQTVIPSIIDQQEVFLLPEDADVVETTFFLDDPTGQFEERTSRVYVEKPITRDGETIYRTVAADEMGTGGYSTTLERDQRYRMMVENMETGQQHTVGPYVATSSQEVTLKVDSIDFDFEDTDIGYRWGAEWVNETDPAVDFGFEATDAHVEQLTVEIRQRGGEEHVILSEGYTDVDTINERALVPESIEEPRTTSWVVEWQATVDGDQIDGSTVVGPTQQPIDLPGVSDDVLAVVSVFLLLMVGGLFSVAHASIGAIITSLFAGVLWFVGIMPDEVTGMLVALALLFAVVNHARGGSGGGNYP